MDSVNFCKETMWLCENAKNLEKFSGQWVVFSSQEGLVQNCTSMNIALKSAQQRKSKHAPFLFHVPSKEELVSPFLVTKK